VPVAACSFDTCGQCNGRQGAGNCSSGAQCRYVSGNCYSYGSWYQGAGCYVDNNCSVPASNYTGSCSSSSDGSAAYFSISGEACTGCAYGYTSGGCPGSGCIFQGESVPMSNHSVSLGQSFTWVVDNGTSRTTGTASCNGIDTTTPVDTRGCYTCQSCEFGAKLDSSACDGQGASNGCNPEANGYGYYCLDDRYMSGSFCGGNACRVYTVSGNIYRDVNMNGLIDASDPLLSGVNVTVRVGSYQTTTNTGSWSIANVPFGNYWVTVSPVPTGFKRVLFSPQYLSVSGSTDTVTGVNFLVQGFMLSGYVFVDYAHDGVKDCDNGYPSCDYFLVGSDNKNKESVELTGGPEGVVREAAIDEHGYYLFYDLVTGGAPYQTRLSDIEGYTTNYTGALSNPRTGIVLSSSDRNDINFSMTPIYTVSGTVYDSQDDYNCGYDEDDGEYKTNNKMSGIPFEMRSPIAPTTQNTNTNAQGKYSFAESPINLLSDLTNKYYLTLDLTSFKGFKLISVNGDKNSRNLTQGPFNLPSTSSNYDAENRNYKMDYCVSDAQPWYQVSGGGDIRMPKIEDPVAKNKTASVNNPPDTIFFSSSADSDFLFPERAADDPRWVVDREYTYNNKSENILGTASYSFYENQAKKMGVGIASLCDSDCTVNLSTGLPTGIYKIGGDLTISNYVHRDDTHVVLLVKGTARIESEIKVSKNNNNLFILAAKEDVIVDKDVGVGDSDHPPATYNSTATSLEGIYTAERNIIIDGDKCEEGLDADLRLNVGGVLIANSLYPFSTTLGGGILQNNRSLCGQDYFYPTLQVQMRPDFLLELTDFYKDKIKKWEEVLPSDFGSDEFSGNFNQILPSFSAAPAKVGPGGLVTLSWRNIENVTSNAWIGLFDAVTGDKIGEIYNNCSASSDGTVRSTGSCSFTIPSGTSTGTYMFKMFPDGTDANPFAAGNETEVVVGVSVIPSFANVGTEVTVAWNGVLTPSAGDWLGLYPVGTANNTKSSAVDWFYVNCTQTEGDSGIASGSCSYKIVQGLVSGTYEFKMFSAGGVEYGKSGQLVLKLPSIMTSVSSINVGKNLTVSWKDVFDPATTDMIALYRQNDNETWPVDTVEPISWMYTSSCSKSTGSIKGQGSCTFTIPKKMPDNSDLRAGTFEFRLFGNIAVKGRTLRYAKSSELTVNVDLSASPTYLNPGKSAIVTWYGIAVPTGNDWIGFYKQSALDYSVPTAEIYTNCTSVPEGSGAISKNCPFILPENTSNNVPDGIYEFRIFDDDNSRYASTAITVKNATLSVVQSSANPGAAVTVSWTNVAQPASSDWIGLFDSQGVEKARININGGSGNRSFTIPSNLPTEQNYHFRLYSGTNLKYATSGNIYVKRAGLSTNKASANPGQTVRVDWSNVANPTVKDWIGLYKVGVSDARSSSSDWMYTVNCSKTSSGTIGRASGSCNFVLPRGLIAGNYEFRLFANDGSTLKYAESNLVDVKVVSFTADPSSGYQGGSFDVTWNNLVGSGSNDYIGFFKLNESDNLSQSTESLSSCLGLQSDYSSGTCSYTVSPSLVDGDYNFRIFDSSGYRYSTSNAVEILPTPTPTLIPTPTAVPTEPEPAP